MSYATINGCGVRAKHPSSMGAIKRDENKVGRCLKLRLERKACLAHTCHRKASLALRHHLIAPVVNTSAMTNGVLYPIVALTKLDSLATTKKQRCFEFNKPTTISFFGLSVGACRVTRLFGLHAMELLIYERFFLINARYQVLDKKLAWFLTYQH